MESDYLFDTHALIWTVEDRPMASAAERAINLAAALDRPIYVSPISAWERAMLVEKGRIRSPLSPKQWFDRLLGSSHIAIAELTVDIMTAAAQLPPPLHGDPADRMLIATARANRLTLITHDRAILRYAAQGYVRALEC